MKEPEGSPNVGLTETGHVKWDSPRQCRGAH